MKRFLILFMLAAAVLLTAGCGTEYADFDEAELTALLTETDTAVQPGTAGSSLNAARMAALLMDWSAQVGGVPREDGLTRVVQAVRAQSDPNAPVGFHQKLAAVDGMHKVLLTNTAVLADSGYEGSGGPWSREDLAAYEALMAVCGLR